MYGVDVTEKCIVYTCSFILIETIVFKDWFTKTTLRIYTNLYKKIQLNASKDFVSIT